MNQIGVLRHPINFEKKKMKQLFTLLVGLGIVALAEAQPPKLPVTPGSQFGASFELRNPSPIQELPKQLAQVEEGKEIDVQILAEVVDVCPKKGCWLNLKLSNGETAFVKMKDYAFFLPLEIKGKKIYLDGKAFIKTTSVDELKHYAEDAKKPQSEIDAIKEPKKEVRLLASGIRVAE